MLTFSIRTNSAIQNISKLHFFILNKGLNSGRPSENLCPNCFVLITETNEEKEFYYWLTFGLWQSKAIHQYLRGSVIPFIIIGELKKLIIQASEKAHANPDKFYQTINSLKQLHLLEKS